MQCAASLSQRGSLGVALAFLNTCHAAQLAQLAGLPAGAWALGNCPDLELGELPPDAAALRIPGIAWAATAGRLVVPAAGARLLAVTTDRPEVTVAPAHELGLLGAGLSTVTLEALPALRAQAVKVDFDRLRQLRLAHQLDQAQVVLAWLGDVLRETFHFIGKRPMNGGVLAALPVIRHRYADLDGSYRVLQAHRRSLTEGQPRPLPTALLMDHLGLALPTMVKQCQQLVGSRGFLSDHPLSQAYRDMRTLPRMLNPSAACRSQALRALDQAGKPDPCATCWDEPRYSQDAQLASLRARARRAFTARAPWQPDERPEATVALHRAFTEEGLGAGSLEGPQGSHPGDLRRSAVLMEELMQASNPGLGISLMVAAGTVFPLLHEHAQAALRDALRDGVRDGTVIFSFGITEAAGGSDLANAVQTRGRFEGSDIVIDGEKRFITNAPVASHAVILLRTGDGDGALQHSLVLVPTDTEGVERSAPYDKLGLRSSPTGTLRFHSARVPRTHLIGRPGMGLPLVAEAIGRERVLGAAGSVALAWASVHRVLAARLSDVTPDARRLDSLLDHLALLAGQRALIDEVLVGTATDPVDRDDASLLKFSACEAAQAAIEAAADALRDDDPERLVERTTAALRDSRIFSVFAGASELMRDAYSTSLLPRLRLGAWKSHA